MSAVVWIGIALLAMNQGVMVAGVVVVAGCALYVAGSVREFMEGYAEGLREMTEGEEGQS